MPLAPEGIRYVPSGNLALSSSREIGLITLKLTGPWIGFQIAAAKLLMPASDRSSVRALGRSTVLLASSTKEVSASVRWYDPKKNVLFRMIGPPMVPPPSWRLRIGLSMLGSVEEEVVGHQGVVLMVVVAGAVEGVGAALRHQREVAAAVAAGARVVQARLQLDFLQRFRRRRDVSRERSAAVVDRAARTR